MRKYFTNGPTPKRNGKLLAQMSAGNARARQKLHEQARKWLQRGMTVKHVAQRVGISEAHVLDVWVRCRIDTAPPVRVVPTKQGVQHGQ